MEDGYSRDEIFDQLRKIALEEERLYGGKQINLDFTPETEASSKSDVGKTQQSLDAQPEADFEALVDGSEDPVRAKKLWHGTQALIISNIPKGQRRQFALNEKNLFLKASANTTDSKFTFLHAVQTAYDVAEQWLRSNADAVELGMTYWDLNERNGFHSKKVQSNFNTTLKALLNVAPHNANKKEE
ncbi:hypothetical protein [Tellurirhabdus rosea]|uniref:hypothetical protein n=1 Tax=Tellurirhabdus rosea TaxID=2674997 RepID=UPI002252436B|nr:hypothetical protein [Tellurirhabdus rosea]